MQIFRNYTPVQHSLSNLAVLHAAAEVVQTCFCFPNTTERKRAAATEVLEVRKCMVLLKSVIVFGCNEAACIGDAIKCSIEEFYKKNDEKMRKDAFQR